MPFALLLIGAILLVAGLRNTYTDLWALVKGDFTQNTGAGGNFLTWVAAIAVVGGLGYIPKFKALSVAFMTLLLLVLVLSNGGIFAKLQAFIKSGAGGNAPATPNLRGALDVGDVVSSAGDFAKIAANLAMFA